MSEFVAEAEAVREGVVVLAVRGEVDLLTAADLERRLQEVLAGGARHILLDLGDCEFFDSSGLNVLAQARRRPDGGMSLSIIIPPDGVTRPTFEITHFEEVFPIFSSRDEALERLRDPRSA